MIANTFRSLVKGGVTENDAEKVMSIALDKAEKSGKIFENESKLYSAAIKNMKAGEFMKKRSDGGHKGVTVMTSAASNKADESTKKGVYSRKMEGNVYRPRG